MPSFHTDGVMRMMRFLFEDISPWNSLTKLKKGYREKVEPCCMAGRQALEDGLTHAWIDTCCIDKSSSAELSEAINSMFRWYAELQCAMPFSGYHTRNSLHFFFPSIH